MSDIIKITKPIIIKYEERETKLSKDIKEKIEIFCSDNMIENDILTLTLVDTGTHADIFKM